MTRPVIFRARTLTDINDAYHWYQEQRYGLGETFMVELGDIETQLGQNPELFQPVRGQIRRAMLRKFPYGVFYVVRPNFVSVLAVMHHARDPKHWQRRARSSR